MFNNQRSIFRFQVVNVSNPTKSSVQFDLHEYGDCPRRSKFEDAVIAWKYDFQQRLLREKSKGGS